MKKAIIPIVLVLLVLCGIGGLSMRAKSQSTNVKPPATATVTQGDLVVSVVETGTIDADKTVEVKSRVTGRLAKLSVEEGDRVRAGQTIALIDPQETQLLVQQNQANLVGARSAVAKQALEIVQRRAQARAGYEQAKTRVAQLSLEAGVQPTLTRSSIMEAQTAYNTALEQRRQLLESSQPTQLNQSKSAVAEAEANYENALLEQRRQNGLLERGFVAQKSLESANLGLDLAKVRVAQAKENLAKLEAQFRAERVKADEAVRQSQAGLTRARANSIQDQTKRQDYLSAVNDLEKAEAALQDISIMEQAKIQSEATVTQLSAVLHDAQRQLRETEVKAPIDGVVTKKLLQVGELASGLSGFNQGTGIVRIEDRRSMRVKLDVNEIDMAKMKLGMQARIDVDAIPNHPYHGTIRKIAPSSKEATPGQATADAVVKYEVEILVNDADANLRSGLSAKCALDVIHREKATLIPLDYLVKKGNDSFVYIQPAPKAKPEQRKVVVGAESGSLVEVISGVKVGEVLQKQPFSGPARKGAMQFGGDDNQ